MDDDMALPRKPGEPDEPTREHEELVARFRALGVDDPQGWAQLEVKGKYNIAHLAGQAFLHALWPHFINSWRDPAWIDRMVAEARTYGSAAFTDAGHALDHLMGVGVSRSDIMSIARGGIRGGLQHARSP